MKTRKIQILMALVAYDYSGSENEEEDAEPPVAVVTEDDEPPVAVLLTEDNLPAILSQLPETQAHAPQTKNVVDDKLEDFIPKYQPPDAPKERKKVKISIPSLSDFAEEEEPQQKKVKSSVKGSTLLSILPPVKGSPLSTKSFIPYVLKNKPVEKQKPKDAKTAALVPNALRKNAEKVKLATIKKIVKASTSGSDLESDDDVEIPETFDDEMWQKVCGRKVKPKQIVEPVEEAPKIIDIAPEPVKPYDGLDNTAFKELVGKSKKPVNIKLIDINEEEILPDKNLWLTKSLTDPDQTPKPVIENPVDPTRKKKHHITYLAEQAKANEQELSSQWSASKHTRNQTRAKYGF